MGCKNSKAAGSITVVQSANSRGAKSRIAPLASDTHLAKRSRFASNPDIFAAKPSTPKHAGGSHSSLEDDSLFGGNADSRHSSAGSKFSKHSQDSGFDRDDNVWENIITEDSDPNLVEQVEKEFVEGSDLGKISEMDFTFLSSNLNVLDFVMCP